MSAPLSADAALWVRYHATRADSDRNAIVVHHLPLVAEVANRNRRRTRGLASEADIQSDGALGLIKAVEAFDPGRGVPFEAFARLKIREAIIDGIRARSWQRRGARDAGERAPKMIPDGDCCLRSREPDPSARLEAAEDADAFWADRVRPLKLADRLMVVSRFRHGLEVKAVGNLAGLRESQAGVRLATAILKLREHK